MTAVGALYEQGPGSDLDNFKLALSARQPGSGGQRMTYPTNKAATGMYLGVQICWSCETPAGMTVLVPLRSLWGFGMDLVTLTADAALGRNDTA